MVLTGIVFLANPTNNTKSVGSFSCFFADYVATQLISALVPQGKRHEILDMGHLGNTEMTRGKSCQRSIKHDVDRLPLYVFAQATAILSLA